MRRVTAAAASGGERQRQKLQHGGRRSALCAGVKLASAGRSTVTDATGPSAAHRRGAHLGLAAWTCC